MSSSRWMGEESSLLDHLKSLYSPVIATWLQVDALEFVDPRSLAALRISHSSLRRTPNFDTALNSVYEADRAEEEIEYYVAHRIPPFEHWRPPSPTSD